MSTFNMSVYKLYPDVELPTYSTEGAACFDIKAYLKGTFEEVASKVKVYRQANQEVPPTFGPNFSTDEPKIIKELYLWPGDRALVPTGFKVKIPLGFSLRIHPRSGLAIKAGLMLANCEGIIDSDYYHEVFVPVINASQSIFAIEHNMRIAQGEIVVDQHFTIIETKEEPQKITNRQGGFGSTGVA